MSHSDEQGMALLVTLLIIAIVSVVGLSMANYGATDLQISDNYRNGIGAFYAADSGIEQSIADLLADDAWATELVDTGTWGPTSTFPDTVTINAIDVVVVKDSSGNPIPAYYPLGEAQDVGAASFVRQVFLPPSIETQAAGAVVRFRVRSTGSEVRSETGRQTVRAEIAVDVGVVAGGSVWDQILSAGDGTDDEPIDFSDRVHLIGSVRVVGDGTGEVELEGDLTVSNNYGGVAAPGNLGADASRLPALLPQLVNGEEVESLNAVINVRDADLVLEQSDLGAPDVSGNAVKETLDGVNVEGGDLIGDTDAVHADQIGTVVSTSTVFPHLDDSYCADPGAFPSQRAYIEATGLRIYDIDRIDPDTPQFSRTDGDGNSIAWDPDTGLLQIEGIIIFDGDLRLGDSSGGGSDDGDSSDSDSSDGDSSDSDSSDGDSSDGDSSDGDSSDGDSSDGDSSDGDSSDGDSSDGDSSDGDSSDGDSSDSGSSGGDGGEGRISYEGTGTIYAERIDVRWDLVPVGNYLDPDGDGPMNNLGLIATERLELANGDGDRIVRVMAAMFSDDEFRIDGDSRVAGAMVGARFKSVRDVQATHVPSLAGRLPPGMPGCPAGGAKIVSLAVANWYQER